MQRIEIEIDGNNVKVVKAVDGTVKEFKRLDTQATKTGGVLDSVFGSLSSKVAFGIGAATASIGYMIKEAIDLGDNLNDLSKRTGVSVEQLSTMKYAAETSGSSFEGMGGSIIKLNKNIYDAISGGGEVVSTFNRLDIQLKDTAGNVLSTDQVIYQLADRFKDMPDGAEKTALAIKVFGKSGAEMIPMLNDGAAGLIKMQEEARNLGLQFSTANAQRMDEFNDKLAKIKGSAQGAAISLVDAFGDGAVSLLNNFAEGLDVLIGKTELINGAQYKEPVMALAAANEYSKLLVNTTKEYREEQIKIIQNQIAMAASDEYRAKLKLQELQLTLGIFTLLSSEDEIQAQKIRDAKTTISVLTKQLELYRSFGKEKPKVTPLVSDSDVKAAERLKEEWADLSHKLQQENMLVGLNSIEQKEKQLTYSANELKIKFLEIPGAIELINFNLDQKINQLYKPEAKIKLGFDSPDLAKSFNISPSIDMTRMLNAKDQMIALASDISAESMVHFQLMEGAATNAFGGMGDALMDFATLSDNTNAALFAASKGFSIAQAIMNTYEGATKALAQGGFWGFAMAAAVITSGLANVARIASTQPGSRGGGGGISAGSSRTSIGSMRNDYSSVNSNNTATNTTNVTLQINGDVLDPDQWFRRNRAAIKKLFIDGVVTPSKN